MPSQATSVILTCMWGKPSDGLSTEVGLGERVVLQLCRPLQGGNYRVFCDNFFSTAGLFDELLQQNIYACGTARTDRRGFPETLKKVAITERGQYHNQRIHISRYSPVTSFLRSLKSFRLTLATQLIGNYCTR